MYRKLVTLFSTRLLVLMMLALGWQVAQAAALYEFKGTTPQTKSEGDNEIRLSLLGLSDDAQNQAVVQAFREYLEQKDAQAFDKTIQEQQSRGYLFTKAAAGYSVKYAWQDQNNSDRIVLLVTPALKTRNPYLWKEQNQSEEPFSVLELRKQGEELTVKTSLDSAVVVNDVGQLQLQDYDNASVFATLKEQRSYNRSN
jgi:hypothetical protein